MKRVSLIGCFAWLAVMLAANLSGAAELNRFAAAPEAFDPKGGHIQGIAASEDALYVSQMTRLVKLDWQGKVLASRRVQSHTGDIAWHDGELYTAVAVYPERKEGRIQVFDKDLNLLRETVIDRTIDGIAYAGGVLYVGMGAREQPSKKPHRVNILGRFDAKTLKEIAPRAEFDYGFMTKYGFQNIVFDGKRLIASFYAVKGADNIAFFDETLKVLGTATGRCNQGFDILPISMRNGKKRFVRATTKTDKSLASVSCKFDFIDLEPERDGNSRRRQLDGVNLLHLSHVHRGGGKLERPDNTLETFRWCRENGSALECDCRRTKDGVGIMLHDKTLARTARGISPELARKDVSGEVTWEELKDVDVGSYLKELNPAAGDYSGNRIPTIEATFAAMKGHPSYLCFVDEKGAGPEYIAMKAREAGVLDQVYYTGKDYQKALDWNRSTGGGKSLIWIGTWPRPKSDHNAGDIARFEAHYEKMMDEMRANGFKGVSAVSLHSYYNPGAKEQFVPRAEYLKKIIAELHSHNIPVCSIPFEGGETEEVYYRLWELGCDGFSTDYPSVMFKVIKDLKRSR